MGDDTCSVVLFSEDSSKDAIPTVRALFLELLRLAVDGHVDTRRIRFLPPDDLAAEKASKSSYWKGRRNSAERVKLIREIATRLMQGSFVVFHLDADMGWRQFSASGGALPEEMRLRDQVRLTLERGRGELSIDEAIGGLIFLIPCHEIEAWTYQNTREAAEICRAEHGGRCLRVFGGWSECRTLIDEIEDLHDRVCLGKRHNLRLAMNRYPSRDVMYAGTSFANAVAKVRGCSRLMELFQSFPSFAG